MSTKPIFPLLKKDVIEHTEPDTPTKGLETEEFLDRIESALLHPFHAIQNMEKGIALLDSRFQELINLNKISRQGHTDTVPLGLTIDYTLNYHRRILLYAYCNTGFTLLVTNGATQQIAANYWSLVQYPDGSHVTVQGGSDTNPLLVTFWAIDVPLTPGVQLTGGAPAFNSALTTVPGSNATTPLLASNALRKGASFYNESAATLYLALAATASLTAYTVQIAPGGFYELPPPDIYIGAISGIWSASTGNARITELS